MIGSKYNIDKNISVFTMDKHNSKVLIVEGHYWLEPLEEYDVERLFGRIRKEIKKIVPKNITILDFPDWCAEGKRSVFDIQVSFKYPTRDFFSACKRITPLILKIKCLIFDLFSECGFRYHLTKKGA